LLVEEGGAREPFPALGRARVGEAADVALARGHVAFAAVGARVHLPGIRDSASICPNYGSGLIAGSAPSHGQGPMPAYYRPTNENTRSGEDAMSRTLRTALLVATVAAVSALAPSARAQEAVTLHGAVQFNDDHAFNKALLRFEQ